MKPRMLGVAVGLTAVLGGLLVAAPAQADDGMDVVRVYYPNHTESGGGAEAWVHFGSRTAVEWRDFTVADRCPGDGRPVRARLEWVHRDGTRGQGSWKADTNGCGDHGTNFGDFRRSGTKAIGRVHITVCVYTTSAGNLRCKTSTGKDNPWVG